MTWNSLTFRCPSRAPAGRSGQRNAGHVADTIESLREWQPYNIVVTPDGSGFCVAWIGRGRHRVPVHSQWFDGYEVSSKSERRPSSPPQISPYACLPGTLAAAFPSGYGAGRHRQRTVAGGDNDDDFDSPPGGQTGGYDGSETFASGTIRAATSVSRTTCATATRESPSVVLLGGSGVRRDLSGRRRLRPVPAEFQHAAASASRRPPAHRHDLCGFVVACSQSQAPGQSELGYHCRETDIFDVDMRSRCYHT